MPHLGLETRQACILWVQRKSREVLVVWKRREELRFSDAYLLKICDSRAHDHLGSVGACHFFLGFVTFPTLSSACIYDLYTSQPKPCFENFVVY